MATNIETLRAQIEQETEPRAKIDLQNRLVFELSYSNPEEAQTLVNAVAQKAEQLGYAVGLANSYRNMGILDIYQSEYHHALAHFLRAIELYKDAGCKEGLATTYNNMGVIYYYLIDYENTLTYYKKSLQLSEEISDYETQVSLLSNIGAVYAQMENTREAKHYFERSLALAEAHQDYEGQVNALHNLAHVTEGEKLHQAALNYALKAKSIVENHYPSQRHLMTCWSGIGLAYRGLERFSEAIDFYQRALELSRKLHDKREQVIGLREIGECYIALHQMENALDYLKQAEHLAEAMDSQELEINVYESLFRLYEQQNDIAAALAYHKKYHQAEITVLREKYDQNTQLLQVRFQVEQKEREAELYRRENEELERLNAELEATNQKLVETQAQLIESQAKRIQAEKRATLGELAGMVTHEINNALSGIRSSLEQIYHTPRLDEDRIWHCWENDQEGTELQAYLAKRRMEEDHIIAATELAQRAEVRAEQVIKDLKSLVGDESQELGTIHLVEIFRKAVRLQWERLERINIIEDIESEDLTLTATSGEIGQLFLILLSNASDALKDHSEPEIHVKMQTQNGGIQVDFSDNGCGIPPSIQAEIFHPFFTTKGESSSGVGLSTFKRIIDAYNGTIHLKSDIGKGTTFSFWLPEDAKGKTAVFKS
ncbi:MAG: tetratricopeptide repeat protein [Gemmatimonadetes bacterium]|nr:MAG: tetratricopeptide repeat protein [Gemmatimonadota bacterium]